MNLLDTSPDRVLAKEIQAVQMHVQHLVDTAPRAVWCARIAHAACDGSYDMVFEIREASHASCRSPALPTLPGVGR